MSDSFLLGKNLYLVWDNPFLLNTGMIAIPNYSTNDRNNNANRSKHT